MRLEAGSVLGTFSKGNSYSFSLNFGVSGGRHCDASCCHHPKSSAPEATRNCYAVRAELRGDRIALAEKLQRHEQLPPSRIVGKAILELQDLIRRGKRIDWLRISTNGSVPKWDSPECTTLFKSQLVALLRYCVQNHIKVHFPVETGDKAAGYRTLLDGLVTIRQSVQGLDDFIGAEGAVSFSVGAGLKLNERISLCRTIAKERNEATGRKTVVCPAVTASFRLKLERDPAKKAHRRITMALSKCGNCDACARENCDIVYPDH